MKFVCEKNILIKEITIAQDIISSRNSLSILSNVLLETTNNTLFIKATDLKVGFSTQIPVETEISGSTTVFCDKFLGILRALPEGDISFDVEDEKLFIKPVSQKISFQLRSISSDKYPEMKVSDQNNFFTVSQNDFIEMINQTIFAVSDDVTRHFMNGVYFEKSNKGLIMVSTDGRRLAFIEKEITPEIHSFNSVIVPPKFLQLIKKLSSGEGNVSLSIQDNYIFAEFDTHKIYSTLIEGQFPNYKRVIPESQKYSCVVDKNDLNEALKRVSLLVEQKSRRLFIEIEEEKMTLYSEESEIGMAKEEIFCDYSGESVKIAVNYTYLTSPLRVMNSDKVVIAFTEANRAVTLLPQPEADYIQIIMPMQLD